MNPFFRGTGLGTLAAGAFVWAFSMGLANGLGLPDRIESVQPPAAWAQDQQAGSLLPSEATPLSEDPGTVILFGDSGVMHSGPEGTYVIIPPTEGQLSAQTLGDGTTLLQQEAQPAQPAGEAGAAQPDAEVTVPPIQFTCECQCP